MENQMKMYYRARLYYNEKKENIIKTDDPYFRWRWSYLLSAVITAASDCDNSSPFLDATNEQLYSGTIAAPITLSHKQITKYNLSVINNRIHCLKNNMKLSNDAYYI